MIRPLTAISLKHRVLIEQALEIHTLMGTTVLNKTVLNRSDADAIKGSFRIIDEATVDFQVRESIPLPTGF